MLTRTHHAPSALLTITGFVDGPINSHALIRKGIAGADKLTGSQIRNTDVQWIHDLSYFFGGLFFTNAIPHLVNGVTGHAFQTPFASPPGKGLSPSRTNVLWGFFNLIVGYCLVCRVGDFALRSTEHVVALGAGGLLAGLVLSRIFGPLHGGDA